MTSTTTGRTNAFATVPSTEELYRATQNAIEEVNRVRECLARLYARLPADEHEAMHPEAEFEIGESLQAVRKAYVRLRKARGVLAQGALPFNGGGHE